MKILKRILIGIIAIILIVFLCYFIFHIDTVQIEGTEFYTDEEIEKSVFTRDFSDNMIVFFVYEKIYGINTLPFVEEIEAEYQGPRSITLHVYDKKISGCIEYMGQYVYFDKEGIVLQTLSEKREGVPVVTGINFGTFTIGKPFQVEDSSVFDSIMNVSQQIEHYGLSVDKIKVTDGAIRIMIGSLKVDLGKKSRYDDEMAELAGVIEKAQDEQLKLDGTINMENYETGDRIIVEPSAKKKSKEADTEASASPDPEAGSSPDPEASVLPASEE